jgi:hypothetical protein
MKFLTGLITGIIISIILLIPAIAFMAERSSRMSASVPESDLRKCMREMCGYEQ